MLFKKKLQQSGLKKSAKEIELKAAQNDVGVIDAYYTHIDKLLEYQHLENAQSVCENLLQYLKDHPEFPESGFEFIRALDFYLNHFKKSITRQDYLAYINYIYNYTKSRHTQEPQKWHRFFADYFYAVADSFFKQGQLKEALKYALELERHLSSKLTDKNSYINEIYLEVTQMLVIIYKTTGYMHEAVEMAQSRAKLLGKLFLQDAHTEALYYQSALELVEDLKFLGDEASAQKWLDRVAHLHP